MVFPILPANTLSGGYDISGSCRFNLADSPALSYSFSSTASSWTVSFWTKLTDKQNDNTMYPWSFGTAGSDAAGNSFSSSGLAYYDEDGGTLIRDTSILFRDPSAWYHVVCKNDGGTITTYMNGVQQATGSGGEALDGSTFYIGRFAGSTAYHLDGYISEFYFIDGTAYSPSTFAETDEDSGIWKPKSASVTFGSDGLFLQFKQTGTSADSSGIGADTSGNDNHMTVTNLAATDVTTDTPTNNFCTWNPLAQSSYMTLSEGNCATLGNSASNNGNVASTFSLSKGKWYFEYKMTDRSGGYPTFLVYPNGSADAHRPLLDGGTGGGAWVSSSYYRQAGDLNDPSDGDIIGVRLNMDDEEIKFYHNDSHVSGQDIDTGGSTDLFFGMAEYNGSDSEANFGNPSFSISSGNADANGYGNFEYAVPSGFYALCTKNLAKYG